MKIEIVLEGRLNPLSKVKILSTISLIISFFLIGLLLFISYKIWYILFYLIGGVLLIGFVYRSIAKDDGIVLKESKDPRIFKVVKWVARVSGSRMPDKIVLVQGTMIGVSGIFQRKLIIGIASIRFLSKKDLISILFHEFAHFKGLDNIIGSTLMKTTVTIKDMVSGASYIHFIVYYPMLVFYYLYALATLLYSRQREYMADWFASSFVSGKTFGEALEKYSKVSADFDIKIDHIIRHYASKKLILRNIYDAHRKTVFDSEFERQVINQKKKLLEQSSVLSTHPATITRVARVRGMKGCMKKLPDGKCFDLFNNLDGKEEEMTSIVYRKITKKR